ncbi:MAG: PstS family phosphate ABC transporter substrate-binding protein [Nitrososphaerota archaeon]|nr:PstS family phosphate ABC transporter substrate-binding protein [Candidatus Calditenuaceae archaeon]MDW8073306.1 PstS family phosphate ABC transporter substrate-binding protein [Nitrososphaerota archaeon]
MASTKMVGLILAFLLVGGVIGYVGGMFVAPAATQTVLKTVTQIQTERQTVTLGPGQAVTETVLRTATVTERVTVTQGPPTPTKVVLSGDIIIDGSSTVYPITEAAAEAFMKLHPNVKISVGISGTGGGFKRFVVGETDINDASRPITKSEAEAAQKNNIEWIEVPIAIDGLVVVVNRQNDWVDCLTISELRLIWNPNSTVRRWSDIRSGWPSSPIVLYGPGPDSGTFDYFTERVVGKAKSSRTDYVASEDDNVLVAGVEAERFALGYFGYAYYPQAADRIRIVPIKDDKVAGAECVIPTDETVRTYKYPLARPLFIYVNKKAWLDKPALKEFVIFYVENGESFVKQVGYTSLPSQYYKVVAALLKAGIVDNLYTISISPSWRNAGPR